MIFYCRASATPPRFRSPARKQVGYPYYESVSIFFWLLCVSAMMVYCGTLFKMSIGRSACIGPSDVHVGRSWAFNLDTMGVFETRSSADCAGLGTCSN
jgi:hypothetical protein